MSDSQALSFARLVDWVEGRLSDEEAATVAVQVAADDEATHADVAWLRAFHTVGAATVLAIPPPETRALLIQRFEAFARSRRQPGLLQRLVATLTFDGGLRPTTAGIRRAGMQGPERQLVYSTDAADIALNIQPRLRDQKLDLNGQIFPKVQIALGDFSIQLVRDAVVIGSTTADDLGEFTFEDIPTGVYALNLRADQLDVLITSIELRT